MLNSIPIRMFARITNFLSDGRCEFVVQSWGDHVPWEVSVSEYLRALSVYGRNVDLASYASCREEQQKQIARTNSRPIF